MFSRFLRRDQGCDHRLLQTKFLARVIDHDPEVSKKIVADNAIEPSANGLTEHGEEIGDHHDEIVDSSATNLERFQGGGGNIDLRAPSGERTDERAFETELLCQLRVKRRRR